MRFEGHGWIAHVLVGKSEGAMVTLLAYQVVDHAMHPMIVVVPRVWALEVLIWAGHCTLIWTTLTHPLTFV